MKLDTIVEIKSWLAVGPFEFNHFLTDPVKPFYKKDLKRYGVKEGIMNEEALEKAQRQGANVFLINTPSPQIKLQRYVFNKIEKKSNFYLVSRIYTPTNQDVTLIMDGSNSYTVWLNGDKLIEVKGKYNVNKVGDRFVNISLKKGENQLFVKVNRGTNVHSWDFICTIAPCQEAKRIFQVNYASDFIVNPIIHDFFEVYTGPYSSGKVEIQDVKDQTIAAGTFENQNTNDKAFIFSELKKLEDGFYKIILTIGSERLEEMIYGHF
jgi:hypothetical protein